MDVEEIARFAHEANAAYCRSIGDFSQPRWEDAPQWQRDSAISGVRFIIAAPFATPADSHENWLRDKERDGWRYGPVKDPIQKTHPCFRPYKDLPEEQRIKDSIFGAVVRACISMNGGMD